MMSAKDVARKMLVGCGHSQPIIVPHDECVEAKLQEWEANIRLDCARTLAAEHRQAIDDYNAATEKAKQEVEKLSRKVASMDRSIESFKESNALLRDKLRAALAEIDDLRSRLRAEEAQKQYAKFPSFQMVEE